MHRFEDLGSEDNFTHLIGISKNVKHGCFFHLFIYVNTFKLFFHCSEKPVQRHLKNVYSCLSICMLAAAAGGYVHLFTNLMQASVQLFISFTCTSFLYLDIKNGGKIFVTGIYIIISYIAGRPVDYHWFYWTTDFAWNDTSQPSQSNKASVLSHRICFPLWNWSRATHGFSHSH